MALQILTIFQTKKVHVPHLFSDPREGGRGVGELFKRWIALSIG